MSDEIKQTEGYKLQNLKHQYLAVIVGKLFVYKNNLHTNCK